MALEGVGVLPRHLPEPGERLRQRSGQKRREHLEGTSGSSSRLTLRTSPPALERLRQRRRGVLVEGRPVGQANHAGRHASYGRMRHIFATSGQRRVVPTEAFSGCFTRWPSAATAAPASWDGNPADLRPVTPLRHLHEVAQHLAWSITRGNTACSRPRSRADRLAARAPACLSCGPSRGHTAPSWPRTRHPPGPPGHPSSCCSAVAWKVGCKVPVAPAAPADDARRAGYAGAPKRYWHRLAASADRASSGTTSCFPCLALFHSTRRLALSLLQTPCQLVDQTRAHRPHKVRQPIDSYEYYFSNLHCFPITPIHALIHVSIASLALKARI